MSAPFFILLPGGAKNFSICEKAETSWLTSSLVALKVDDGHSLKARGAFEAIWIDQSQISIWITEEEEKQWKGEVRGLEKQDLLYSSMLMDQCQDIILTIYTSQQASLLNQIRKLIFKTIYNFNNKTIFDPFVFRDSLTNSDHGQWTIPHPYSYTHTSQTHRNYRNVWFWYCPATIFLPSPFFTWQDDMNGPSPHSWVGTLPHMFR